jgi:hypothetical protein
LEILLSQDLDQLSLLGGQGRRIEDREKKCDEAKREGPFPGISLAP